MKRLAARLRYFASDAMDEFRRSPGANLLATATLTAVLFVAGLLVLVQGNVAERIRTWRADVRVDVYLRDDASAETVQALRARIAALPGVARVRHVTRDEALERYRAAFPDLAGLPREIGRTPLPASLEAFLAPGPGAADTARAVDAAVSSLEGVESVRYDQGWLDRLEAALAVARRGGAGIGILVLGALAMVMAGVLRLAVLARRDEIETMLLVGATPGLVRGPFLVAGGAQGGIAAVAALVLVEATRRALLARAGTATRVLVEGLAGSPFTGVQALALVAMGVGVGVVAAGFAVRLSER